MRIFIIVFLVIFSTFNLMAEWEESEKGYITSDTLIGNMRYILDENALVVENKYSIKKVDLNTGNIIKEIVFDDTTHNMAVADDNLDKVYLLYDGRIKDEGKYVYYIINFKNKDTVVSGEMKTPYYGPKVERNLSLLNDTLLFFTGNMIEDYQIFQSTTPFSKIIKLDLFSSVKGIIDSDFYFDRYNLWNSRNKSILVISDQVNSTGKHGGGSLVKLKHILLDSLRIYDLKKHETRSNEGYVPRAIFNSYSTSNNGKLIYYEYEFLTNVYLPDGRITYSHFELNQIISINSGVLHNFDNTLGDFVQFTTDDKWLVSTKMRGENSVDFKLFSLEGELIFSDNVSNVTNEQIICFTDSTYFFESGSKILMYNPFNYNLTNVSEQNTKNLLDIYPNPTNKFLNINLTDVHLSSKLTVIDQLGNIIESVSLDPQIMQNQIYNLNVSKYPTGIYFIQVRNQNETITAQFVKI